MNQLILTKQSSENEIKNYFKAVLKLAKSSEEFPINIDDVWPLVYSEKGKAVRALKENFMEGIDYYLAQNGKVVKNNELTNGIAYSVFLSLPCMEFFIARKVRPVFEVYRKIFHRTTEQLQLNTPNPSVIKSKLIVADWAIRTLNMNENSKLLIVKSIAAPFDLPLPNYTLSKGQLLPASALLKKNNVNFNVQEFNKKMIKAGFLEILERPSHKGVKHFKSLTNKAIDFGENQVSPLNPKETQPLYYVDKFSELLNLLQIA